MSLRSHGTVLIKNTGLNLGTQAVLILVFLVTTPLVVHGLGEETYGLLSLTVVVVGIFGFLDLGMSHAAVKFVSEHLARGESEDVHRVASACLIVNVVVGLAGAALIALLTPLLISRVFQIPEAIQPEGRTAFYLLAVSFPFVLIEFTLKGITSALQRFDIVNLVTGVAGILQGLVPVGLILLGYGLVEVVLGLTILRVLSCMACGLLLMRVLPEVRGALTWHRATIRRLLGFGSWMALSALVWPVLVGADRVLIGVLLSTEAVAFYAVPFGIASRLKIGSASLAPVLFPAFSERVATLGTPAVRSLFLKSAGLLLAALVPVVLLLVVLSEWLLAIWMGDAFAERSTSVLQLLALGMLANSVGAIPLMALLGMGRSDIIAKTHLLELPVYLAAAVILIPRLGIVGAAAAWLIQVVLDLVLLSWSTWRLVGRSTGEG